MKLCLPPPRGGKGGNHNEWQEEARKESGAEAYEPQPRQRAPPAVQNRGLQPGREHDRRADRLHPGLRPKILSRRSEEGRPLMPRLRTPRRSHGYDFYVVQEMHWRWLAAHTPSD